MDPSEERLRQTLDAQAPQVDAERGRLLLERRLRVRRIARVARWPVLLGVLALLIWAWTFVLGGGCSPGAPELAISEVVSAEIKVMYPEGGSQPAIKEIDLNGAGDRDRLLAAYRSMEPFRGETGGPPTPDLYLTLSLTEGRQIVISLAQEGFTYLWLREFRGGELRRSAYLQPNQMRDYLLEESGP